MSEKEEEFPFEQFVQALSDDTDIQKSIRPILTAVTERNAFWTYSAVSTLVEMLRSKEEDPNSKCRCLEAVGLLMATQEYPVLTLIEVYMLPLLQEVALFRSKKTDEQTGVYFQQICSLPDSAQMRKDSMQFVGRAIELVFLGAAGKPHRTVQTQQLKQASLFAISAQILTDSGVPQPQAWKWVTPEAAKRARKDFLAGLRRFEEDSEAWAEFLLVNLLEEVQSGKKELLQLRQLLPYGENFLTSPVINVCEDELNDLGQNFEEKRRFIGLLNELVRCGDIQAIIMIKNSEFLPAIAARVAALPGHLGTNQGESLFPEIQAPKQAKRQFYCDFLKTLENWATSMPKDYDSEEFNIAAIYKLLKNDKKFKFPDNLLLTRYQKETKENLLKNQERNEKLIEILEQTTSRQPSVSAPFRSNMKHTTGTLSAQSLQKKLEQAQKDLKELMNDSQTAEAALNRLTIFKDNWIGYLQALDLEQADEEQLEVVVGSGEKFVEQIQLITPLGTAFAKGKLTRQQFKQRIAQSLQFHLEVSRVSHLQEGEKRSISVSMLRNSRNSLTSLLAKSQNGLTGKSKIQGRELRSKIKEKSRMRAVNPINLSRAMDRSNISKIADRSRLQRSKNTERSKQTEKSRMGLGEDFVEKSRINQLHSHLPLERERIVPSKQEREEQEGRTVVVSKRQLSSSVRKLEKSIEKGLKMIGKSVRSEQAMEMGDHHQPSKVGQQYKEASKVSLKQKAKEQTMVARARSKDLSKQPSKQLSSQPSREMSQQRQQKLPSQHAPSRLARIQEYQISLPQENPRQSRRSGPRIMLRRSHSKIQHSRDREKGSIILSKQDPHPYLHPHPTVNLEASIQSNPPQSSRTKKVSLVQSSLHPSGRIDQTIQLNGNVIKQGSMRQKSSQRSSKPFEQKDAVPEGHFDDFRDERQRQISSIIHSSAKEFLNSAEQILSTAKKSSFLRQNKRQQSKFSHKDSNKPHQSSDSRSKNQIEPKRQPSASISPSIRKSPSSVLQNQQQPSEDLIVDPELAPMRHSFHRESSHLLSPRRLGDNPQFRQVFTNRYEGLQARERQQKMLQTNNSGLKNIIKSKPKHGKDSLMHQMTVSQRHLYSQRRMESPRLHMEYGGSYHSSKDLQFQAMEEKKNREITQLREKIRELEKETMTMRTKLVAKDNELRSIKNGSVAGSERNFQFTSPGDSSRYGRASRSHQRSQKGSIRGSSIGRGSQPSPFQKQVQNGFKQYLQRIKGTTFRKSLLKQKCLIHKSDQLQIGCLSQTGETVLEATLYITPHRFDLMDFTLSVQHDSNLRVRAAPEQVRVISGKKQQKVHITIEVLRLPFCLPELELNYKAASLVLPLAFNKFCKITPAADPPQSHLAYLRSDDFKFNPKVAKLDKLGDSFTGWSVLPHGRDRGQCLVMAKCAYSGSKFSVCLNLSEKVSWIEGFLVEGQPTAMNFFMCTFKEILDAGKK